MYDTVIVNLLLFLCQLDNTETYAGSAFSLREPASANHCAQCIAGHSASSSNPWQMRSRPVFLAAQQSPCYNGFRGSASPSRFTSRQTPFSYNDSPPQKTVQGWPATTSAVSKVRMLCSRVLHHMGF